MHAYMNDSGWYVCAAIYVATQIELESGEAGCSGNSTLVALASHHLDIAIDAPVGTPAVQRRGGKDRVREEERGKRGKRERERGREGEREKREGERRRGRKRGKREGEEKGEKEGKGGRERKKGGKREKGGRERKKGGKEGEGENKCSRNLFCLLKPLLDKLQIFIPITYNHVFRFNLFLSSQ